MFVNFNKVFNPTKKEMKKQQAIYQELKLNYPNKSDVKLIKRGLLYESEGLAGFDGDCLGCSKFVNSNCEYTIDQGYCKLHKCNCGYGFTCDNFKGR